MNDELLYEPYIWVYELVFLHGKIAEFLQKIVSVVG